jgi:DNA repair protein RadC
MTTEEKPDYLGHRKRLRERFILGEGKDMPDYELLELLLMIAIPRRDVKPIAKRLIKKFGSFAEVINASIEDLQQIEGIKETSATILKIVKAAALRMSWQNLSSSDAPVISNWDTMVDYCRSSMGYLDIEEFHIIFLNSKLQVIGEEVQQRGTINQVAIHPREVIKSAINKGATAIILAHNHPSGDVTPSKADLHVTKQIKEAANLVNIELIDHLIISKNLVYGFKDHGAL